MSSHHIIRENQEPAVAFLSAENCDLEVLHSLLEWSPHVVAIPDSVDYLVGQGIKVDAILGNEKRLTDLNYLTERQSHIKFQKSEEKKPILAAIDYLERNNHKGVYLITAFDNNTNELAATTQLSVCVIDGREKWSFIKSGKVRKWFPENATLKFSGNSKIQVLDKTQKPIDFDSELKMPFSGIVAIESEEAFWLGEQLG